MSMPKQKPGSSKQDYQTPPELLQAVKHKLNIEDFWVDLAASRENKVCDFYYSEEDSAFDNPWSYRESEGQWAWCNPPYGNIAPWVKRASEEALRGAHICILIPSSVGSDWWREWVEPYAYVLHLNGRLKFVGAEDYYPKDCSILLYTPWQAKGSEVWNWRK